MKIAIVHNLLSGGAKRALHEFCKGLHRHGHTLDLYIPSLANEQFLPLAPYVQQVRRFPIVPFTLWQTRALPLVLQYLNLPRRLLYLEHLKTLYRSMALQIDNGTYDLAFVHHCQVVQSPYVLRYLRTPSVYYCQEPPRRLYEPAIPRPYTTVSLKQRIRKRWYAPANLLYRARVKHDDVRNARSASQVLVNSYFSRESIYRVYGVNARVVYLGVDSETFTPASEFQEPARGVLAVGRTFPEKGYDFLIRALGHVPASRRPTLTIVADMNDPQEEAYLSTLAEQHGVNYRVYTDISDQELVHQYQRAALFVYAAVMEPFGLAPLEALACGLPVIAVKEGGVRETVRDGEVGFLTQRDPQDFSEKLLLLLDDAACCKQFGNAASAYIRQSWIWTRSIADLRKTFVALKDNHR